jgi:tetratricopeptide (TPR) repeat protein
MSGDKVNYLPSRHLKITVDKEAVVRNGIVPENMKDRIVNEIVWTIPSSVNYLYKNDLMLLDFFASNDWTRAVYFTSLSDIKNILDIDKYLHQEGLAHRFMPVVAESYYKDAGGVFVDGSYELLMSDDIRWGNLNDPDVAVDPESRRSVLFVKQAYMRLAQTLANTQRKEEAVAVLDKCLEFFPNDKIPYDVLMMTYPEIYYVCGAIEKGDAFMNTMLENCKDNLRYYYELDMPFLMYYTESIYENLAILDKMKSVALKYKRNDLRTQITNTLKEENSKFYPYLAK